MGPVVVCHTHLTVTQPITCLGSGVSLAVRVLLMHVGCSFGSGEMQNRVVTLSDGTSFRKYLSPPSVDGHLKSVWCYLYSQNVSSFIPWDSTSGWRSSFSFTATNHGTKTWRDASVCQTGWMNNTVRHRTLKIFIINKSISKSKECSVCHHLWNKCSQR